MRRAETIHGSVLEAAAARPDATALMYMSGGAYASVTYRALIDAVELAAERLRAFGLRKGDVVGILSPNRPQWVVADLAVLKLGGIVVPIYHTLPADQLAYIIKDSGMRMLFAGSAGLLEKVEDIRGELPGLEEVIFLDDWGIRFAHGEADGRTAASESRTEAGDPDAGVASSDEATICYTSGTTGEPKGVVLTHRNIVSNVRGLIERYEITSDDSTLSYLPLAHMFERTCGHYVFLSSGGTVAYAEGLTTVARDVAITQPTVLIAVPRVLERAYKTAVAKVESGPWVRRGLAHRAFTLLNERANRRFQGRKVPIWLELRCRLYDALVAGKFRTIGGNRLRIIVSGGAPLDRRIGKILRVVGFGLVEGYGMTEASPVVCCGDVADHKLGTVGRPLKGVEVKIAEGGEILVRGPNVMKGYLNKPEETAAVLDADGWLHTGDLGETDELGCLIVTGRSKEIIVTSYGKNIAPATVEEHLLRSRYVEQTVVFGDNRKTIVALIVPHRPAIERFAREQGISTESYETLIEHHAIVELVGDDVKEANEQMASYERVTAFALLAEPFSAENGLLTPTLKLRRRKIAETYTDRIEALYDRLEGRHARGA